MNAETLVIGALLLAAGVGGLGELAILLSSQSEGVLDRNGTPWMFGGLPQAPGWVLLALPFAMVAPGLLAMEALLMGEITGSPVLLVGGTFGFLNLVWQGVARFARRKDSA